MVTTPTPGGGMSLCADVYNQSDGEPYTAYFVDIAGIGDRWEAEL